MPSASKKDILLQFKVAKIASIIKKEVLVVFLVVWTISCFIQSIVERGKR
jgi:hypothetical protein